MNRWAPILERMITGGFSLRLAVSAKLVPESNERNRISRSGTAAVRSGLGESKPGMLVAERVVGYVLPDEGLQPLPNFLADVHESDGKLAPGDPDDMGRGKMEGRQSIRDGDRQGQQRSPCDRALADNLASGQGDVCGQSFPDMGLCRDFSGIMHAARDSHTLGMPTVERCIDFLRLHHGSHYALPHAVRPAKSSARARTHACVRRTIADLHPGTIPCGGERRPHERGRVSREHWKRSNGRLLGREVRRGVNGVIAGPWPKLSGIPRMNRLPSSP